ncbi:MAG: PBP1A family penicillin-binding protein [Deltaproteobacteria bacterium]|nr:PBP1A family penicillin-binding protein [Deltaproteobacteria bacterium]
MWSQKPQAPAARSQPTPPRRSKPRLGKPVIQTRRTWLTVLKWGAIVAFSGALLLVATAAFVFWMFGRDPKLPDYKSLSDYKPKQVTTILDANDRRIGEIYTERRTYVPYEKVPPIVVEAFIAAEDNKFWTHGGVDYWGMFRAAITNVRAGKSKQGASTITQQVVKTFLLTPEKTYKRKIQEIIIARRLEKGLTKQEIMALYVNQIYFGHGRYGIQEAARYFFGKDVEQLNPGEAAVLASMPKKPEVLADALYGRGGKPQDVKDRQVYVLNQLVVIGKLTNAEAQKWIDAPIQIVKNPFPEMGSAPEWIKLAEDELIKSVGKDAVDRLGAKVRTTLDPGVQAIAQKALQSGLRAVDKRQKIGRPRRTLAADKVDDEIARLAKKLPAGGPKAKHVYEAVVTEVFDQDQEVVIDLGAWKAALVLGGPEDDRFNPAEDGVTKKASERFKPGDVVDVTPIADDLVAAATGDQDDDKKQKKPSGPKHAKHRVTFPPAPEGAVVIIETKSRKVRGLVGGYASKAKRLNRAFAERQPGSSFKPFVYAAAIETGRYTPASVINDAPEVFDLWRPKNYESGKFEGPVLLRHALAKSINTVAIRVTYDLKPETVATLAKKMGIRQTGLPHEMSLALGSGEVTPLDMTNAFATFAAGGMYVAPRFVDAIDGKVTDAPKGEQVMRAEVAFVMVDMMQSVVNEGTGHLAKALKIPIAGKTGTSNEARDVWFVGMTADYTIGVWVGHDEPKSLGKSETGGSSAVPVFVDIVKNMKLPAKAFPKPAHVVTATIDKKTGLLSPEGAPKGSMRSEVFLEGTAPTEVAPMPDEVTTDNAVTGEYTD